MIDLDARALRSLTLAAVGVLVAACGTASATVEPSAAVGVPASPTEAAATASSVPAQPPGATSGPFDPTGVSLSVDVIVDGLEDPVDVAAPGDGSGRLFVVEQPGRIRVVLDGKLQTLPFLDIEARIASGGERGLLGLALHPAFPTDPRLFVDYTDLDGDTVVAEYRLDAQDEDVADPDSERILLHIDQPFANHNGGAVVFGSDGMLYISMGDGGSGGDPQGNGRRLDTLLAKILRIDVDGPPGSPDAPYRIPADNPFLNVAGAMPEIWLTGLRNPWRMRFDRETGDLWIGDVGQGSWEEIDMAPAGKGGLDFGWNRMEGFHCYEPPDGCDESGLTLPVAEYDHGLGCAVIGGVVVRDPGQPMLDGGYLFSDSCSGNLWLLDPAGSGRREPVLVLGTGRSISSIGLDDDGSVVATDHGTGELIRISAVGGS
jgi:glucose/arabinose dehydrogenase